MARDANGIYSLPAGSTAVTNTTIESAPYNTLINDIATALTNSLPRNGAAAMTGTLNGTSASFSGTVTATLGFTGALTGNVTGNITSTGTSTFTTIDVNGGAIDGAIIGAASAAAITGTTITASTGFTGNLTGNVTGNLTGTASGNDNLPAGTAMLFVQTAAPTGWTKSTTHNDKALRIVSGTASSGGTSAFSTVFGKTATDGYTLTTTDIPSHTHTGTTGVESQAHTHDFTSYNQDGSTLTGVGNSGAWATKTTTSNSVNHTHSFTTDATGGGGSHAHGMDIRVQYVDCIIATKN